MRTTLGRNRIRQIATTTVLLLLAAMPGLAEEPLPGPTLTQQTNARRLILTNECVGCDLAGVTLLEAHLIGADLRQADLTRANLTGANLEGADLTGATLTDANLTGAFLTDTCLTNTLLVGVNFTRARLYNTDVRGAIVEDLNLADAEILNTPISIGGETLPDDILPLEPQFLEPMIPFEETQPPVLHPKYILDPIL